MIDKKFAEDFATAWIEAWNSHDLDQILAHYADDCVPRRHARVRSTKCSHAA